MLEHIRKKQKFVIWAVAIVFVLGMAPLGFKTLFTPKPSYGKINGNTVEFEVYNNTIKNSFDNIQQMLSSINSGENRVNMLQQEKRELNTEIRKLNFELEKVEGDSLKMEDLNEEILSLQDIMSSNDQMVEQINTQITQLKEN